jgi:hypothetical protein
VVGFEKGVGEDDELAHAGGQGELGWFSGVEELEVFCLQVRIEASGDEGWQIERLSQAGATTSNEGAPCQRPDWRAIGASPTRLAA